MTKKRTELEAAAGKLISAIQKEWNDVLGEPDAEHAEEVMNRAHSLLQASKVGSIDKLLDGVSVTEYLDAVWVEMHPSVKPSVIAFSAALSPDGNV